MIPILILVVFAVSCHGHPERGPDYFMAAVFEHDSEHGTEGLTPEQLVKENLKLYKTAVEVASQKDVDIIVFSEYGVVPYDNDRKGLKKFSEHIPDPRQTKENPCNEKKVFKDRPILRTLSCLAQKYKMYVVGNMIDIQPCDIDSETCDADRIENCDVNGKCPVDGDFIYNTDVVFDREGNLIARYHKNHLYFEVVDTPKPADFSTFETEFGTFGMIVCFDSIFEFSANFVEKYGVETLLFPTYWFDDIVPLKAVEFQQAWALANNVNLLAANGHCPGLGTLGSGIYSKYFGALAYTYNPDGKSKLLVAQVPRNRNVTELPEAETDVIIITGNDFHVEEEEGEHFPEHCYDKLVGPAQINRTDYRCFKSQTAQYTLVKLNGATGQLETCNNGLCCSVTYAADSMDEDYYLAVFNGSNDVNGYFKWAEETCLLVRCDPFESKPCVIFPSKAKTVFHKVELRANITAEHIYPTVSTHNNRLAPMYEWNFEETENGVVLKYDNESGEPLLKVGLMGRCYERDPPFVPFY